MNRGGLLRVRNRAPVVKGIFAALGIVALFLAPVPLDSFYTEIVTQMLIFAILAMSLDILMGYTGLQSLGHAGFFGVGAYTVGLITVRYVNNLWLVLPLGILAGVVVAAVLGVLALRTSGGAFLMTTLALGQVLWAVVFGWRSVTGGGDGLPGIRRPDWGLPWSLNDTDVFYYFIVIIFVIATVILYRIVNSPFGLTLVGIRESETRMQALGHNIWVYKFAGFVIAGAFAALAGSLFAYKQTYINPESVGIVLSAKAFLMVIIGGPGTLFGPAIGAGVIVFFENFLSEYTARWELILGAIFVIAALAAPDGVHRAIQLRLRKSE